MNYFPAKPEASISANVRQFLKERNLIQGLSPAPVRINIKKQKNGKKAISVMQTRKNRGKSLNKAVVKQTFDAWRVS